jgi:hypothetical protein
MEAAGRRDRQASERTLIAYDELWRLYIAPKLQDQSLNTITRADIERVVHAAAKRSAWRAHDALKVLRRLLSAAVDAEAVARNPALPRPTTSPSPFACEGRDEEVPSTRSSSLGSTSRAVELPAIARRFAESRVLV